MQPAKRASTSKVSQGVLIGRQKAGQDIMAMKKKIDANRLNLKDEVVSINRVTKVVKGGKNMSFAALVVIGDPAEGVVGYGSGKAKEVPQAIRKGIESANPHNVIKATFDALIQLRNKAEVAALRGKAVEEL